MKKATKKKSAKDRYQGLKDGAVKPETLTEECIAAGTEWISEADAAKEVAAEFRKFEGKPLIEVLADEPDDGVKLNLEAK